MTHPLASRLVAAATATAGLLFAGSVTPAPAADVVRIVAPNQPLPGGSGDTVAGNAYSHNSSLSRTGDIILHVPVATAADPGGSNSAALLLWRDGQLDTLLRTGTPFDPQQQLIGIDFPAFSTNGRYVALRFATRAADGLPPRWVQGIVARDLQDASGQWTPLTPSQHDYYNVDGLLINDAGRHAFNLSDGSPSDARLVAGAPGGGDLKEIAKVGATLPGGETALFNAPLGINAPGQTLFVAGTDTDSSGAGALGVYRHDPGNDSLSRIVARNDPAPGIPNAYFAGISLPPKRFALSDSGRTAFTASVVGPGVSTAADEGIWAGAPAGGGSLQLLAREGSTPPGLDKPFTTFDVPRVNAEGDVLFLGGHSEWFPTVPFYGWTPTSLWITDPDSTVPRRLAAAGDDAPGTPGVFASIGEHALAENGTVAFVATYQPRDGGTPEVGLWVGRPGHLQLLLTEGDTFQVDGRTARLTYVELESPVDLSNGHTLRVTDDGRVLVHLYYRFDDLASGHDLFLVGTPIPEPTSAATLLTLALAASRRRRR